MAYNKQYMQAAILQGQSFFSYQSYQPDLSTDIERYQIVDKLGKGKYSQVFKAYDCESERYVAIKILKPIRQGKIKREIKIMNDLKECKNILKIEAVLKDPCSHRYCLITELVSVQNTMEFLLKLSQSALRQCMYQILKGIKESHSKGIFHRDIKPQNILIQKQKENFIVKIIDWGLAQYYLPGKQYNTKVCARNFKGPQLFLNNKYYDYSLDMWSFGLIFAAAIFRKQSFLKGENANDFFRKIVELMGSESIENYICKYKLKPSSDIQMILREKMRPKTNIVDLINEDNWQYANDEALDLLSRILVIDHSERLPVYDALKHPYFEDIAFINSF